MGAGQAVCDQRGDGAVTPGADEAHGAGVLKEAGARDEAGHPRSILKYGQSSNFEYRWPYWLGESIPNIHGPIFSQRYFSFDQGMIYSLDPSSSDHGIGSEAAANNVLNFNVNYCFLEARTLKTEEQTDHSVEVIIFIDEF